MSYRRRALAALTSAGMMVPLVAAGTAHAAPGDAIPPQPRSLTLACENVLQTEPFTDILANTFERAVECVYAAGITTGGPGGLPADQYGPTRGVARDAMASFVARLVDTAVELSDGTLRALPAYDGTPAFTDVPVGDVHFTAVNRLEQAGIVEGGVAGRPATTYSPKDLVTRAQMASFLARAFDYLTGSPLRTENDYYTDDEGSVHQANINGITSVGIAVGDGRKSYSPRADVRRDQMAGFLARTIAAMVDFGLIDPVRPDSRRLVAAVTADNAYEHLERFQAIADAHGDNRASGLPGYDASVEYVVERLETAGYEVDVQAFDFDFFQELGEARIEVPNTATTLATATFTYSGSTDDLATSAEEEVTAQVVPVDYTAPTGPANSSTSGCEATDFTGFPAGAIALIQRGTCTFETKAANAETAGAVGVIIFNEGQEGRQALFQGTLGRAGYTIPVVGLSFQDAEPYLTGERRSLTVYTKTVSEVRETYNVLTQTATGDPDKVVMLGAHLDSVPEGPGINDNGSGSAGILEVALQMAAKKEKPTNAVRFAWWGAEELGLLGAEHYVAELTEAERAKIALYLNFDMIASPNFGRFVYDGDGSAFGLRGPQGSSAIEYAFADFFASQGLASEATEFSGRSDYGPFIAEGVDIPSGGLFTGAEGIKTAKQAELYGGTAGVAYDPNYHQAGDDIDNIDMTVFDQNLDAIAHVVSVFGASTEGAYALSADDRESGPGTGGPGDGGGGGLHDHDHDHGRERA